MKNQNNNLQPSNFFYRLKMLLYSLFHKLSKEYSVKKVENENINIEKSENEATTIFEEYKLKNERRNYLLDLQRKYKTKEILEEDMSEKDRIDLENLYIEQNSELKRKIRAYDTQIAKMNKG